MTTENTETLLRPVRVAKMPFRTKHFNENQKVWLQEMTGALAAKVVGRYRGSGRYISAWIKFDKPDKPAPKWKVVAVNDAFADIRSIPDASEDPHFHKSDS